MKDPKQQAEAFYAMIRVQNPELWFEVIVHLHLLALRDHYGYLPAGLDAEFQRRASEMLTKQMLNPKK